MTEDRGLSFGNNPRETTKTEFANNRAYLIGINTYQNGIPQLRTAVADAEKLAEILNESHEYTTLTLPRNGAPSLATLRDLLHKKMLQEVGPNDRVLIYFAGHGIALDGEDGPEGYLVPEDANREDRSSLLSMTELNDALARLPCRHLLLILDCCFAGAFRWSSTRDLTGLPSVIHRERYERYIQDPAWQVLTSAAHDQKALDVLSGSTIGERTETGNHSPFASALFCALKGDADLIPRAKDGKPNGDGVITATELYLYLRECVETATVERRARQTPGLWPLKKHGKGEYILLTPGHELNLPPAPELNEANNPYRGLQSFDEEHAPLFFGRSKFVEALAERVADHPLTIVLGASGTGKSSVVKAGLLPFLRFREADAWQIASPFRPGKSPLAALAALTLPGESGNPDAIATRLEFASKEVESLAQRVANSVAKMPSMTRLLIVVDQFEELLTHCLDAAEREQFLRQLDRALAAHRDQLRLVLTLRSDFEPQFANSPLQDEWLRSRIVVPVMTLDEYREAIEGPASVQVLYFHGKTSSQAFIDRLIGDVANTPGALPLLSFTLSELYRRYLARDGDDRALMEEDYNALGGVGGSLRNRADEVYRGLPDDDYRATMKRVMLRMVSVEGGELARRRVSDKELVYEHSEENLRVLEIVRLLTESRLVVEGTEVDGEPFIEPAHDELLRGWSTLLEWSREEAESLQLRRRLTPASLAWTQHHGGLWLWEPRLNVLKQILDTPANWLNQTESLFLRRSLAVRRMIVLATTSVLVVAFAVITVLGFLANAERQRAVAALNQSQQDLARSLLSPIGIASQLDGDLEIPQMTLSDAEALWNVAVLTDERVRLLFLRQALASFTTANQLRNRLDAAVHCAVGLDRVRRSQVINEIVLPILREKKHSREPLDLEVRMACAEISDELEAYSSSSSSEIAHLCVQTAIDLIQSQSEPDSRAVVTFRKNLVQLTVPELEVIQTDLEKFLQSHSITNASYGIEPKRGPIIGLMLLELKRRIPSEQPTLTVAPSLTSGPLEEMLSYAERQFQDHQRFINPTQGSDPGRYIPALSNRGAVAMVLEMNTIDWLRSSANVIPLREKLKHKSKDASPTAVEAMAQAQFLREQARKHENDSFDNSVAIVNWVLDFETIAPQLPEDERRTLATELMETIVAKTSKTVMAAEFAKAFIILASSVGSDGTYHQLLRILSARSDLLSGWEKPGAHVTNSVAKSYVVGTLLLRDRALVLDDAKLLNVLKYPLCIGAQKEAVLARLSDQVTPRPEKPFLSKWDLVSWIEAHNPALAQIVIQPPRGPHGLEPK